MRWCGCSVLLVAFLLPASQAAAVEPAVIEAVTAPSDQGKLSFNFPGIVSDVAVKVGDAVSKGQVLMKLDDEIERHELEKLDLEANSTARVDAAEYDLKVKQKVYERKTSVQGGFSQAEIEEAELDVVFRQNQVKVAKIDHQGNAIEAQKQRARVERMELRSPIDGIVQEVVYRRGEFAQQDRPAVMVVKNDPCRVEVRLLKTWQVARLSVGQMLEAKYPGDTEWQQAKVSEIAPMAIQGTDRQFVVLELANPQNKATGLLIKVKLPPDLLEAPAGYTAATR